LNKTEGAINLLVIGHLPAQLRLDVVDLNGGGVDATE
jgi:hypothetical protein